MLSNMQHTHCKFISSNYNSINNDDNTSITTTTNN